METITRGNYRFDITETTLCGQHLYDVQTWHDVPGLGYVYSGEGRYTTTLGLAYEYIASFAN